MSRNEFTLLIDRTPVEAEFDALYEAGLDDSTPEFGPRAIPMIHVHRDAGSLATAIISAVAQVEQAGFAVVGVRTEDLVTLKTIAARVGRTYEGIRRLATGDRGPGGFPAPLSGDGYALYSWTEVARWFAEHYGMPDSTTEYDRLIAAADHLVRARRLLGGRTGVLAALVG
jgi:hypothetical protein